MAILHKSLNRRDFLKGGVATAATAAAAGFGGCAPKTGAIKQMSRSPRALLSLMLRFLMVKASGYRCSAGKTVEVPA